MNRQKIGIILGLCSFFAGAARADIFSFNLLIDTSSLNIPADTPYSLEFQLQNGFLESSQQDGGPFTDPSNQVLISNFSFYGGSAIALGTLDSSGQPIDFLQGGASGSISSSVLLQANVPLTLFDQGFTPGSHVGFTVTYTNNQSEGDLPDIFDFGILDSNYNEIPTLGGELGYAFAEIDFDSDVPNIYTYASDPGTPSSNGNSYTIAEPLINSDLVETPEPNMFWILACVLPFMVLRKRVWRVVCKALPGTSAAAAILLAATFNSYGQTAAPAREFFTTIYEGHRITYEIVNGFAVTEGDIVIGEASVETDGKGVRTASFRSTLTASDGLYPVPHGQRGV